MALALYSILTDPTCFSAQAIFKESMKAREDARDTLFLLATLQINEELANYIVDVFALIYGAVERGKTKVLIYWDDLFDVFPMSDLYEIGTSEAGIVADILDVLVKQDFDVQYALAQVGGDNELVLLDRANDDAVGLMVQWQLEPEDLHI